MLPRLSLDKSHHWKFILLAPLLIVLNGCSDDPQETTSNCRITEFRQELNTEDYVYRFSYHNDGMLKAISSENYNVSIDYNENRRPARIRLASGGTTEILTYEYPSPNLIRWTSNLPVNETILEHYIYHSGDIIDSLITIYPQSPTQQYTKAKTLITYNSSSNAEFMVRTLTPCCNSTKLYEVEHDNGVNPNSLVARSSGLPFVSQWVIFSNFFIDPLAISENNVVRYELEQISQGSPAPYNLTREFLYEYNNSSLYPSRMIDGSTSWSISYENCD